MRRASLILVLLSLVIVSTAQDHYKADWDDLDTYPQAEWLNEAKFGMYWHWNFNSIAGESGWYGRFMYTSGGGIYKRHLERWGAQDKFGYKDFEPYFTAEKFNAEEWVEDAERIGARFIVGMAVHHDGFDMYNSSYTPWNSVDKNPHIDVIGELQKEAAKRNLKFGATSHLAFNWEYFSLPMYPDKYDALAAPELYNIHDPEKGPTMDFVEEWYMRTKELIDNYDLDFLWFDFGTRHENFSREHTLRLTAHYYNQSVEKGKTVALATKTGFFNKKSQVFDCEHAKFGYIRTPMWMSDCTFNRKWFNLGLDEDPETTTGEFWAHQLIDIVSKNGTLLLNLGPKADGSWTEEWKQELFKVGEWLTVNGEAIYNTKPWHRYGEGPTHEGDGGGHYLGSKFSADDIRFTRTDKALYAIVCGWRDTPVQIESLGKGDIGKLKISSISMLGAAEEVEWKQTKDYLSIGFPQDKPCEFAYVFKIEGEGLFPDRRDEYLDIQIPLPEKRMISAIKVSIPGKNKKLSLAEICIDSKGKQGIPHNTAFEGVATLSSTSGERVAALAIDNNLNGNPNRKSVAETTVSDNPWLTLKFDNPKGMTAIELFAGMDGFDTLSKEGVVECFDENGTVVFKKELNE